MNLCMEEFERMNPIPAGVIRCGNGYAATDWGWASRYYVNAFKAFSDGWKASRAALCIELPKTPSFSASDEPDLAFEEGVDVMKEIIEAVGVTCK